MTDLAEPSLPEKVQPRRLSEVLRDLEAGLGDRIALGDLVDSLRDRSFAPLMVLFAIPNVFLYLPGSSVITGLPLMLLGAQLLAARPTLWLPEILSRRSLDRVTFSRIVARGLPWIERVERLARPRFWPARYSAVDRVIGAASLLMSILLFLPIPFVNGLPALAIAALGLALSERDGLWLAIGLACTALALALVSAILGGGVLLILGLGG